MVYIAHDKDQRSLIRDMVVRAFNEPAQRVSMANFKDIRFDPDDNQPTYIGLNAEGLDTSDGSWVIYKFTYSGSNATRIQSIVGVWDDRVSLF